jgi:DNA-binding transcriptional ArsR family regulator
MAVTRRAVLARLAATSDADRRTTTTVAALTAALDADRRTVETHLAGLVDCDLACRGPGDRVRVTVTGEEFLALDLDDGGLAVVEPTPTRCDPD